MADLVEWLRAQVDEDERVALLVKATRHGALMAPSQVVGDPTVGVITGDRLLAEVEAKRAIVALAASAREMAAEEPDLNALRYSATAYGAVLRRLALVYADRPGYREEWRP